MLMMVVIAHQTAFLSQMHLYLAALLDINRAEIH
jgi:hypothetical protein